MIQVVKLGHATFETPDLERQIDYYTEVIGLHAQRDKDRAILSSALGQEVAVFKQGSVARCTNISFQVSPRFELAEVDAALSKLGIRNERNTDITPGLRSVATFKDPKDSTIELYVQAEAGETMTVGGIAPRKLGHLAFLVPDAKAMADFYINTLGFRVSDWIEDYFAFLRCSPDHHTVNFVSGVGPSFMHHIAFELVDWAHLKRACDLLARHQRPIIWGPGRHGVGHNVFVYHRDPDDHIIELFAEMDQMLNEDLGYFDPRSWHHDRPQRPKVWDRKSSGMTWGTPPTPDFLRNQSRTSL